ncbi:MAG: helix-turn-helix domain-containing protein [Bacillota bacterium]|nr:helix-turn-helix domain-containing protein [Bacillota bacterium]
MAHPLLWESLALPLSLKELVAIAKEAGVAVGAEGGELQTFVKAMGPFRGEPMSFEEGTLYWIPSRTLAASPRMDVWIRQASAAGVAGFMGDFKDLPHSSVLLARRLSMPLLHLPEGDPFPLVALWVKRSRLLRLQALEMAQEIQQELLFLWRQGETIEGLLEKTRALTGGPVELSLPEEKEVLSHLPPGERVIERTPSEEGIRYLAVLRPQGDILYFLRAGMVGDTVMELALESTLPLLMVLIEERLRDRYQAQQQRMQAQADMFRWLLTEKNISPELVIIARQRGWDLTRNHAAAILDMEGHRAESPREAMELYETLETALTAAASRQGLWLALSPPLEGVFTILLRGVEKEITREEAETFFQASLDRLRLSLGQGIRVGMAGRVAPLAEFSSLREEAWQALAIGSALRGGAPGFMSARHLGWHRYLYRWYLSPDGQDLAGRLLQPLQSLNPEQRSVYWETLRAYLRHGGNIQAMAKDLFLHRNTVRYRIKQLERHLEVRLEDPEVRFFLQLALLAADTLR